MLSKIRVLSLLLVLVAVAIRQTAGHGYLIEPPNRSSLWRVDSSATPNYNDDQNSCGGSGTQNSVYGGKCGLCGDPYGDPHPQNNENTGKFGRGKVVRTYTSGSVIDVTMNFTTNHRGKVEFSICVLSNPNAPESGEDCFKPINFANGGSVFNLSEYNPTEGAKFVLNNQVRLPSGLRCDRCVLRWQYTAGNAWGLCDDGTQAAGCGNQETFRNCADIAIQ